MLDGRVTVITGDRFGIGEHLADLGATVSEVPGPLDTPDAVAAAFDRVAGALDGIDVVVHAHFPEAALTAQPLRATDESDWDVRGEALLRAGLFVMQAAYSHLRGRGGRIILLTPTAGLVGEAGFVPVATASEGLRSLAKAAARQWGGAGITVNCVAPALAMFGADVAEPVNPPALGRAATIGDLARAIALLAGPDAGAITGATIPVDGGVVLLP